MYIATTIRRIPVNQPNNPLHASLRSRTIRIDPERQPKYRKPIKTLPNRERPTRLSRQVGSYALSSFSPLFLRWNGDHYSCNAVGPSCARFYAQCASISHLMDGWVARASMRSMSLREKRIPIILLLYLAFHLTTSAFCLVSDLKRLIAHLHHSRPRAKLQTIAPFVLEFSESFSFFISLHVFLGSIRIKPFLFYSS